MTREEAIRRLKNMAWLYGSAEREPHIEAIDMAIEALSDRPTDEWCTDCKEYDHEKHCCPRFNRVIRTTLNEAVAELKPKFESADAVDVYKAHEEEHLNIINRIKELQYAILGEKHQLSHGRLIDADELKKHLDGAWEELNDDGERKGVRLARWYLISAPTVDSTIDVVRCKDCRHYEDGMVGYCWKVDRGVSGDFFCAYGERREE